MAPIKQGPEDGRLLFLVSQAWMAAYPHAHAGVLAMRGVTNPSHDPSLQARKAELEQELRGRFAGQDRAALQAHPLLRAYHEHYRRFGKTYHIQLQLESIVLKGKPIPMGAALVETMFMAELDSLLLTAGHDLDSLRLPLTLDVANGSENYVLLRGAPETPKKGDMMIHDSEGIISSVVYGPDQRTQITPETRNAIFTTYAPEGIAADDITRHLEKIQDNVRLIAPGAQVEMLRIFGTP
jgi:DNA/RNA-binding domain of Phe-tRNA-synthetase-like protein